MRSAVVTPSPLAYSEEKTNGAKLYRLVVDGGTAALRIVFDHYHPPALLAEDLRARRLVLRKGRLALLNWEKLFPPDGSAPDPNKFDISLLFFLLTTICGLNPPHTGWHNKPPPSDFSLEANIARVKFYRNMCAHVSSSGVDTSTFDALWQDISTVLVDLGLDKTEIDNLKAEQCWEGERVDVLLDWVKSEQGVKSEIMEVHTLLSEVSGNVDETQWTVKDINRAVDKIRDDQEELRQFVEITHKCLEGKLDRVLQILTGTYILY